ncbi:MAG: hypothetical protein KUG71_07950, partial [Porticoccaceae bacterium]|nr:hypothetical protein [Porticoccaceae bacterium]
LDLLRKNSLWGTYLRFLKGLSAQATNSVVRHYAQQELAEYLTDTENDLAMEALTGYLVLATLNPEHLYTFAEQRFKAGDYQSTLRSLALLPQTDQSAQLGLWTAIQLQQWRLYEHLLNFVEAENRDFYTGLQALFAGDIEAVHSLWGLEEQGQGGLSVLDYLEQTSFPSVHIPQAPKPSRLTVISAPELFNVWNPLRQSYNMQYQVRPQQGLKTSITGPAEVLLDLRQLKARSDDRSDDWVKIQLDDQSYLMPINGSDVISALTIKGYGKLMGATQTTRFNIGPGQHKISITPQYGPMAVDVTVMASAIPDLISATGARDCEFVSQWQLVDGSSLSDTCVGTLAGQDQLEGSPTDVNTSSVTPVNVFNSHPDVQVLTRQIWQWEQNGKREDQSLQDIATALIRYASDWQYRILKQRMSKYYGFELLNPTQSAGRKVIEAPGLPIESPVARLAAAAKGYQTQKGTLYGPGEQVKFALELPAAVQAQLLVTRYSSAFTYIPETQITVQQDGKTLVQKSLQGSKTSKINLSLNAGHRDLAVSFNNDNFDQLFTVDFMIADGQDGWRQGAPLKRRRLNTASAQSPLQYYLPRATLLRIDEYDRVGNVRSYHHMHDKAGFYTLNASDKDDKAFRVFKLKRRDKIVLPTYVPETNTVSEANALASAEPVRMLKPAKPVLNLAEYQGGTDLGGGSLVDNRGNTWGLYYRGQSRLNFDEGNSAAKERFHEFGAQQRDYDSHVGRYRRLDILSRFHESGEIVLGAKAYIDWRTRQPGQMLYSKMSAYYQLADGARSSAWSGRADFGWQQRSTLTDTVRNQIDLSGFYLRVADLDRDRQSWDNDVYSAYKKDHENGLKLSNTLRYRPFKDIELFTRFSARSNPLNQHFDGDSASLNLGAQAYLEGSVLNAKFERYRFFADDDRTRQSDKDVWTLGVQHNLWRSQGAHWRVKALIAYDDTNDESTVNFGIGWNDTQGRGISDFRLNEFPFRDLYDLQADQQMSNDKIKPK